VSSIHLALGWFHGICLSFQVLLSLQAELLVHSRDRFLRHFHRWLRRFDTPESSERHEVRQNRRQLRLVLPSDRQTSEKTAEPEREPAVELEQQRGNQRGDERNRMKPRRTNESFRSRMELRIIR
jgi:hypothetical protein